MFTSKLSHTLQVTKHRIWDPSIHKVCECKTLLFFHCMDLVSAVTQKCPSPWYFHLLLRAPLKTFQMHVLKQEVKHVTWPLLRPRCHPESSLTSATVSPGPSAQWGWCQISVARSPACPTELQTFPKLSGHGAGAEPWSLSLPYWIFILDFIKGTTVICHNRTS